jgi:hypothetical protein
LHDVVPRSTFVQTSVGFREHQQHAAAAEGGPFVQIADGNRVDLIDELGLLRPVTEPIRRAEGWASRA